MEKPPKVLLGKCDRCGTKLALREDLYARWYAAYYKDLLRLNVDFDYIAAARRLMFQGRGEDCYFTTLTIPFPCCGHQEEITLRSFKVSETWWFARNLDEAIELQKLWYEKTHGEQKQPEPQQA